MTWLRIDDGFPQHPKIVQLTRTERWAWLEILAYCARYRTQGFVTSGVREAVSAATPRLLTKMAELRLLDVVDGGWKVHDWNDYNPLDATAAERQRRYRDRNADRDTTVTDTVTPTVTSDVTRNDSDRNENVTVTAPRARASAPVPVPSPTPGTNGLSSDLVSSKGSRGSSVSPTPRKSKTPKPETQRAIERLAQACKGTDPSTVATITSLYGTKLPPAAFDNAREATIERPDPHISYAMGTLRSMLQEGQYA